VASTPQRLPHVRPPVGRASAEPLWPAVNLKGRRRPSLAGAQVRRCWARWSPAGPYSVLPALSRSLAPLPDEWGV